MSKNQDTQLLFLWANPIVIAMFITMISVELTIPFIKANNIAVDNFFDLQKGYYYLPFNIELKDLPNHTPEAQYSTKPVETPGTFVEGTASLRDLSWLPEYQMSLSNGTIIKANNSLPTLYPSSSGSQSIY